MKIDVIRPKIFRNDWVKAFFTLRNNSISSEEQSISGLNLGFNTGEAPEIITQNRQLLLDKYHIKSDHISFANQVHSNRVKIVTKGGTYAETDGLITEVPGLALAIQVADCAAVLIADMKSTTIAAVHAGWRGAADDIIPRTMEKMQNLGGDPKDFKAFISPCISLKNFEVGQEVAEQFPDRFVNYQSFEKPHINLKDFLRYQLTESGLKSDNVQSHPGCTVENMDTYYSYRREQDQSGRMMAIIQLKTEVA